MRTTRYVFDEVFAEASGQKKCQDCGKTMQRTFKRSQTINPYNKDALGSMKNAPTIRSEEQPKANADLKEWQETSETCSTCLKNAKPNLEIQMIGEAELEKIKQIMPQVLEAQAFVQDSQKYVESILKGRCVMIPKYKSEDRLAMVSSVYLDRGNCVVYADIVRKDLKGVTEQSDSKYIKWKD